MFIRRDFVSVYKQTILGPLWFFIQPLFTTIMFTVIFSGVAKIPTGGFPPMLFYLAGTTPWNYFSTCLTKTSGTFLTNANLFGKVYFPRLVTPISVVASNLIQFSIQFLLFFGFFAYYLIKGMVHTENGPAPLMLGASKQLLATNFTAFTTNVSALATNITEVTTNMTVSAAQVITDPALNASGLHPHWLMILVLTPVLLLLMALLGLGTGIIASSLTTKYRDLTFLLTFGVQLAMYATPVIYPMSRIPEKYRFYIELNPMSAVIETFRSIYLGGVIPWGQLGISAVVTGFLLLVGVAIFNKVEKTFMDTV